MQNFRITAKAKLDLKKIAIFTQNKWGRKQRNKYLKLMDDCFNSLADTPLMGVNCDYIETGYLKFPQGSHLIFYKEGVSVNIDIIRILHKSMDIKSKFQTQKSPE